MRSLHLLALSALIAASPGASSGLSPGGIPQAASGPVVFSCTPVGTQTAMLRLGRPYDGQEATVHREIRSATCLASGVVFGQPWIMAMSADRSCPAGQWRFGAFAQARAGIWYSLVDRRVCAARIALSDKARGPGVPALIIDGIAYLQPDGTYHLRAVPQGASSPPPGVERPVRDREPAGDPSMTRKMTLRPGAPFAQVVVAVSADPAECGSMGCETSIFGVTAAGRRIDLTSQKRTMNSVIAARDKVFGPVDANGMPSVTLNQGLFNGGSAYSTYTYRARTRRYEP
ncbi:hypothetical protein BH10PSE14_BH10PSE14_31570 [soil metagenome]